MLEALYAVVLFVCPGDNKNNGTETPENMDLFSSSKQTAVGFVRSENNLT